MHDTSLTVELPINVHNIKEKLTSFREGAHVTYNKNSGFSAFLDDIKDSVCLAINNCTPAQRYFIPAQKYHDAYTKCVADKKVEMKFNYPLLNQGQKLMVYHAEALLWSDLSSLDSIYRNCIFSPRGIGETNSITTKKAIQTNLNLALDVALKTTNQHAQFFNTLFQFADDNCKESLKLIQKRHQSMLHDKFTGIEQYTRDLTTQERASINYPGDFTIELFTRI